MKGLLCICICFSTVGRYGWQLAQDWGRKFSMWMAWHTLHVLVVLTTARWAVCMYNFCGFV
ncbi:hypothetical protein [Pyrobaculum calidifontis]|uniref:hypothetical protein n=1 Tax=Pyrobaculum calidifontis TaxID=181486 RepID=UPI00186B7DF0|nr:hypothetical protein [Pyrobaculum calidifontis]